MSITTETAGKKGKKNNMVALFFIIFAVLVLGFLSYKLFSKTTQSEKTQEPQEQTIVVQEKIFDFKDPIEPNIAPQESNNDDKNIDMGFIGTANPTFYAPKVSRSGSGGALIINKETSIGQNGNNKYSGGSEPFITEDKQDMFVSESQNFKASSALKGNYDSNLLLEQGTYIPCVLRQRLISNVGGQISCTVSSNVLSKSGNVVLLEKGTMIMGMYKSAGVSRGSNQIFVIWQQARTASNLVVNLDSGSTDELGANGLTGWVDQHFWERFGNAIVVSMIADVSVAASTQLQKSNSQNYLQNTQNDGSNIASSIIEKMGDIAPTLYKNQGDKVGVFVARDIDFSSVYALRLNK
ncbi:type IV secretion system protein VirB10 [Orbus sturtevantii]|uniref:type IV secretion system protein VirB10 n=1 Tax=Orbus sturtevantii TaxID=3074109 RepID=UPI00370D4E3F